MGSVAGLDLDGGALIGLGGSSLSVSVGIGAASGLGADAPAAAIGGALISTVSYIVNSELNGQSITKDGQIASAVSSEISGAIGGAIGAIVLGAKAVPFIPKFAPIINEMLIDIVLKVVASIAVGVVMGNGQSQQIVMMTSTASSTFWRSLIDATTNSFWESAFCNSESTLFVGTAVEVLTVAIKQIFSSQSTNNTNSQSGHNIPCQAALAVEKLNLSN